MAEQRGQTGVGLLHAVAYALIAQLDPQRQGVDEHPQRAVGAVATLHPAHQYGAEDYLVLAGDLA
ncbi:hypothetical protein ALO42_200080 [Pseudomonas syringae pv. atrofaciens]|nr:hypothetical protein ALO42_200080 [Pseudomonas syringae pv. atrofaciens]